MDFHLDILFIRQSYGFKNFNLLREKLLDLLQKQFNATIEY